MLVELAQRGNFFTTWLVLAVMAFVLMMLMSGTLFLLLLLAAHVRAWQQQVEPAVPPKPQMVRREVLQMLKGIYAATALPRARAPPGRLGVVECLRRARGYGVGYLVFTFFVAWIGSDLYEFFYHRLGHTRAFWWKQHKSHHAFFNPSPFSVIADDLSISCCAPRRCCSSPC
jgi:lathosterol oxidase